MTKKWEGFSAEDILAMNSNHKEDSLVVPLPSRSDVESLSKKTTIKQSKFGKKNIMRERMLTASLKHTEYVDIPPEAALFNPKPNKHEHKDIHEQEDVLLSQVQHKEENKNKHENKDIHEPEDIVLSQVQYKKKNKNDTTVLPDVLVEPSSDRSKIPEEATYVRKEESLDEFEKRHNLIKEENRKKKELLKMAIEDRTKKTKEEAHRLGQINEELKKLDAQLSNDVSILRNQIEVASLDFMEAQKRYDRSEREYLDAKMELFTKRERKELLTGHLCQIIEQSELRKAHKLSDLMDKLRLGSVIIEKPMEMSINEKETKEVVKSEAPIQSSDDEKPYTGAVHL